MENETLHEVDDDSALDSTEEEYPRGFDDCPPDEYDGYEHFENLYDFEPIKGPGDWQD